MRARAAGNCDCNFPPRRLRPLAIGYDLASITSNAEQGALRRLRNIPAGRVHTAPARHDPHLNEPLHGALTAPGLNCRDRGVEVVGADVLALAFPLSLRSRPEPQLGLAGGR